MRDDLRSAWEAFVKPGLVLLDQQGFQVSQELAASVLASGYVLSRYRLRRFRYAEERGFWRVAPPAVNVVRDPRFSLSAERLCSVLVLDHRRHAELHKAVEFNDALAACLEAFRAAAVRDVIPPVADEEALRVLCANRRQDPPWPVGVWQESLSVVRTP
jgi:hypothetical protein